MLLNNNSEKITKGLWLYFFIIILVNVSLKIILLDFSSFWYDEIISVQSASLDFGHIKHVSEWDKNPPFYYYCLSVWIKVFNDSEYCVRLLSVIFSSVSAGILFLFANKHFNKITAIIVSVLYLSSNILFFYSHEARAYSLVVLLTLLSSHIFLAIKEKTSIRNVILLGLINFLLIYTHYIAGIVLFFQFILMLFYFDKVEKKHFSYSLVFTIALVFLRFTKKQVFVIIGFNSSDSPFWLKMSDFNSLVDVLSKFLFSSVLVYPLILLIIIGVIFSFAKKDKKKYLVLNYSFFLGMIAILMVYFLGKTTPIFLDRYLIFSIPFLLLLIAYSLSLIKYKLIPITIAVFFAIYFIPKIDFSTQKAMDYRGIVSFVKHVKNNSDLIIVKTKDIKALFGYYYEVDFLKLKKNDLTNADNIIFCSAWEDVTKDLNKYNRIIVLDVFEELNPKEKEFTANLLSLKPYHASSKYYNGVKVSFYK
jgi:mannosyltransferase